MVTVTCAHLSIDLGRRRVLDSLSLSVASGRLIGIVGPNGAGKSTLLRAMVGLLDPAAGSVTLDGVPLARVPRRELARRIAYLPQGQTVHWPISVERLVSLGRLPHLAPMSRLAPADSMAIEQAMDRADVTSFRDRIATELSGGERARVMLARALAVGAEGLIVDEPLAALDPGHQIDVMTMLRREAESGLLVVVVLHDLTIAARYCQRLVLIDGGRIVDDAAPMDVLSADRLRSVYGITARIEEDDDGALIVPRARIT